MYFVSHFGHAKVYETSVWTLCFQILAKTMPLSIKLYVVCVVWKSIVIPLFSKFYIQGPWGGSANGAGTKHEPVKPAFRGRQFPFGAFNFGFTGLITWYFPDKPSRTWLKC